MDNGGVPGFGGDEPDDLIPELPPFDDGPERPFGSLPHPLDRLWLHPSELSPHAGASATRTKPLWTTTLVAGAAGAILTLAVLGAVGALGRSSDQPSDGSVVPTSTAIATARVVAVAVADSVVAVIASDRLGTRRGSGVCIRRSGEILTSARLVGDASKIDVTTADGVVHRARVLGRDATTDLVLLDVESGTAAVTDPGPNAPPVSKALAEPAQFAAQAPRAGDMVWVVGAPSPGTSAPWMRRGLLASTDSLVAAPAGPTTSGLLETAAVSGSGSTGGALVDQSGDVTGIVLSPVGDARMTYAVPIATALSVANDLRAYGHATHGALGINGVDASAGPTVSTVTAGGPAAHAGVHVGDVLDTVDGHEVYSMDDVMAVVRHDRPGRAVVVVLERGATIMRLRVTLSSMRTS
jgi:S1-C subfamily serine protease